MSGGYFDYDQARLHTIAEAIERAIESADAYGLSKETITKFNETITALHKTEAMVQCIDLLLSDDYGEETFLKSWKDDVE